MTRTPRNPSARRRPATVLAATVLTAGGVLATAPAAHAADPLLICNGSNRTTFTPGLTLAGQPVSVKDEGLSAAVCEENAAPTLRSVYWNETAPQSLSCLTGSTRTGVRDLVWNFGNPTADKFSYDLTTVVAAGAIEQIYTGTITSGVYQGQPAQLVVTLATPDLADCLTTPLTTVSGTYVLTIGVIG